jgi:hypothetical protein
MDDPIMSTSLDVEVVTAIREYWKKFIKTVEVASMAPSVSVQID